MRILVTGSRDWDDSFAVGKVISMHLDDDSNHVIVQGGCPTGADLFAREFAAQRGIKVESHLADWKQYGRSAGPKRNAEMVRLGADCCLAFIKNGSKGATHCAKLAGESGIPVVSYFNY